jgi:mono/diheme cytochrome c family protein
MKPGWAFVLCVFGSPGLADHELLDRDLDRGRTLYASHCASCHGANLQGQADWQSPGEDGVLPAPPHDETGHTWHHDSALLFNYTNLGGAEALALVGVTGYPSGMPGFAGVLSDDEIWDVLAYIRSTWPQPLQDYQSGRDDRHPNPATQ